MRRKKKTKQKTKKKKQQQKKKKNKKTTTKKKKQQQQQQKKKKKKKKPKKRELKPRPLLMSDLQPAELTGPSCLTAITIHPIPVQGSMEYRIVSLTRTCLACTNTIHVGYDLLFRLTHEAFIWMNKYSEREREREIER